jgi:putative Mg2+ transporter-C (MgtC) family protein
MISEIDIVIRLAVAALLSSLVGIERERLQWAAGLRTHMLVGVGAALFMIVSSFGFEDILTSGKTNVMLDPSRVAAQVVSGIGFLGAGTILLRRASIRGLTTAASLWAVAAVGLAVGGGLFVAAVAATVLILVILAGIKPLERHLWPSQRFATITMLIDRDATPLARLEDTITDSGLSVRQLEVSEDESSDQDKIEITLGRARDRQLVTATGRLRALPGVRAVSYREE